MLNKEKTVSKSKNVLFMQIFAFVMVVIILLILYLILNGNDGHQIISTPSKQFKNQFCSLLRPPDWTGNVAGNTFIFKHENSGGIILITTDQCRQYFFSALDINHHSFRNLLHLIAEDRKIKFGKIIQLSLDNYFFKEKFSALRFRITTETKTGKGIFFYTNDVRFFYISLWNHGNKRDEHIGNVFSDYIQLDKTIATPLYKRPVINSENNINLTQLTEEAETKIAQAVSIWKTSKQSSNNVLHAMRSFESAMALIAKSGMGNLFNEKYEKIIEIYKDCRKARKITINKMKSKIFQSKHLGDNKMAKEIAEELIAMASLDSEAEVRIWAKKQLKEIP